MSTTPTHTNIACTTGVEEEEVVPVNADTPPLTALIFTLEAFDGYTH